MCCTTKNGYFTIHKENAFDKKKTFIYTQIRNKIKTINREMFEPYDLLKESKTLPMTTETLSLKNNSLGHSPLDVRAYACIELLWECLAVYCKIKTSNTMHSKSNAKPCKKKNN